MASAEKTALYSGKFNNIKYKILGKTAYTVSICGFGCYRIDQGINQHKSALEFAIKNGINLIDTSANYTDGSSEMLIGDVLKSLLAASEAERDELIIVTKGGYLQGENLKHALQKEKENKPYKEVVKCSPDLWHCIHPKFLEDQITHSLKSLNLKKIDLYLLHNPEYFLAYSQLETDSERKAEYYKRIKKAFTHLEKEVQKGRISYYGISSNTFGENAENENFTSLENIFNIASEISKDNHFAVIQLPLNLIERGGVINKNQENNSLSVLEFAHKNNIGVLVNRPLNAVVNNRLLRLADFPESESRTEDEIKNLITGLAGQEEQLRKEFVDTSGFAAGERRSLYDCLSLSKILSENYERFESPNHFNEIKGYYIVPRANYAISELLARRHNDTSLIAAVKNYAVTVNLILSSVEDNLARKHNSHNKGLHSRINEFLNDNQKNMPLSRKAILMINSLPEVTSALVGMRKTDYVIDILESIRSDYIDNVKEYWLG